MRIRTMHGNMHDNIATTISQTVKPGAARGIQKKQLPIRGAA